MKENIIEWAQLISCYAQAGLTYTNDIHDKHRYQEMKKVSEAMMASILISEHSTIRA